MAKNENSVIQDILNKPQDPHFKAKRTKQKKKKKKSFLGGLQPPTHQQGLIKPARVIGRKCNLEKTLKKIKDQQQKIDQLIALVKSEHGVDLHDISSTAISVGSIKKVFAAHKKKERVESGINKYGLPVGQNGSFYTSREWREIRHKALVKHGNKYCMACNSALGPGNPAHVDHIKPVSKKPDLALELSNLQVLCEECNLGKSNKSVKDWRK